MGILTCECGKALQGRQTRWCSDRCFARANARRRRPEINARSHAGSSGSHANRITAEKLAEVKARFPSCARDWDAEMVEQAWPRLSVLLPRRLAMADLYELRIEASGEVRDADGTLVAQEPVEAVAVLTEEQAREYLERHQQ